MNRKIITSSSMILGGILIGLLVSSLFSSNNTPKDTTTFNANKVSTSQEKKVLYWYDPMYPATKFDKPGPSPFMDMQLVPRYADDSTGGGVKIDPSLVQNLAVKTIPARMGKLSYSRDLPGNVEFNDYHFAKVQPRINGFVEKAYALAIGDNVNAGQNLVDITVPGWASDQSEYILLKSNGASPKLLHGVRERLRLAGMPEELLKKVDKTGKVQTRLTITAPISGVLTSFDVYNGMNVNTGQTLASIQGVDPIWVTVDVPESLLHLVNDQKRIRVELPAYPGKVFYSNQYTLLPQGSSSTRTFPLRITLNNVGTFLRPGMTARIHLRGKEGSESILIPTRAIIDTGTEQRIIVRASDGSFVPKRVKVLRQSREDTAISSGVEVGEEVVVTGLFLIDSEANLSGALEKMRANDLPVQESTNSVPSMGGHDHSNNSLGKNTNQHVNMSTQEMAKQEKVNAVTTSSLTGSNS